VFIHFKAEEELASRNPLLPFPLCPSRKPIHANARLPPSSTTNCPSPLPSGSLNPHVSLTAHPSISTALVTPTAGWWLNPPTVAPHSGHRACCIGIPHSPTANFLCTRSLAQKITVDSMFGLTGWPFWQLYQ